MAQRILAEVRALHGATRQADEIRHMLDAGFRQLNAEFGFAFALTPPAPLQRHADELALIERSYARHLSAAQSWRLASAAYNEQFHRMLLSKLRVVFESAAGEIELWNKGASTQIEQQLRERRDAFARRREGLQRIQAASGELEQRIAEVEQHGQQLAALQRQLDALAGQALAAVHGNAAAAAPCVAVAVAVAVADADADADAAPAEPEALLAGAH